MTLLLILALGLLLMLGIEERWTYSFKDGANPSESHAVIIDEDWTLIEDEFDLAGSATNIEKHYGFEQSKLKGVYITVEGNDGAVTLKTNSSGSPAHTKTYATGGGHTVWDSSSSETTPFPTTDVSTNFWTNAGTATARVKVRILFDPTP